MSLSLRHRTATEDAAAAPSAETDADDDSTAAKGRRRAESRHRRTRSSTLSDPLVTLLRFGLPALILVGLTAAEVLAFALAAEPAGPLPRPVTLVAVSALPLAVVVAARRIGVSMLGALAAAAFATIAPASLEAAGTGYAEHLAVLALLAAIAVGATPFRAARNRTIAAGTVGGLSAAALMAAPLALAALPFLGWQLLRSARAARRTDRLRMLLAAGLAAAAVLLLCLAVGMAQSAGGGSSAFGSLSEWAVRDPVRLAVGSAAAAALLPVRRLRPLALAVLALLLFAQLPGLTAPHAALVLAAPGLALLTGAAVDRSLVALGGRDRRPRLLGVAGVAASGLALLVLTAFWGIAVGDRAASGTEGDTLSEAGPSAAPGAPAAPSPQNPPADPEAALQRAEYGRQLLENPRLDPSGRAAELLADGQVDRRIAIVLGQLLADHDLTVADFPALDEDGPRRQVLVTAMNGESLAAGGAPIPTLSAYLSGLTGEFTVESVTVDAAGVLATFPAAQPENR